MVAVFPFEPGRRAGANHGDDGGRADGPAKYPDPARKNFGFAHDENCLAEEGECDARVSSAWSIHRRSEHRPAADRGCEHQHLWVCRRDGARTDASGSGHELAELLPVVWRQGRPHSRNAEYFLPYAVRGFFDNGGQRVFVARVVGPNAKIAGGDLGNCTVEAIGEGAWGNNLLVAVKPASVSFAQPTWFRIQIAYFRDGIPNPFVDPTDPAKLSDPNRVEPDAFEDFDNLTADPTETNFATTVINAGSQLIQVVSCTGQPTNAPFPGVQLKNGVSDPATITEFLDANTNDPEKRRGLAGLCVIREISLLAAPDEVVVATLRESVIQKCEELKDRFAVSSADGNFSNFPTLRPPLDSTYAAFYYPWVRVLAPHTAEGHRLIPAAGHVTGIYARVDIDRGVHKAPANEVLRGIVTRDLNNNKKPLEFTMGKREQDILNPKGVNVIRDFRTDGRDLRVFGARTMSTDSMWKYVNVRRLFIFIEQSIDRGTQWAVFEPNSDKTWAAIRTSISAFLRTVWRNGAY